MILHGPGVATLLATLHAGCFPEPARWDATAMAQLLAMPGCFAVVAPAESAPIGLALARVAADEAELLTLGVLPNGRRRGIAAALLRCLGAEAVRRDASRLFLEVAAANAPARALYAQAGFVIAGRRAHYYPDGDDALILVRDLGP